MQERMKLLIDKYVAQDLTEAESQELDQFINLHPMLAGQLDQLGDREARGKALRRLANINTEKNLQFTLANINRQEIIRTQVKRTSLVLGIIFALVTGLYLLWPSQKKGVSPAKNEAAHAPRSDRAPGGNKASLTVADGRRMWLDSTAIGPITGVPGVSLQKQDSNTLSYASSSSEVFHTLETPRAGAFRLILADGTRVWLNDSSTLRYPSSFTGTERTVFLTGEAYFEVAQDAQRPFRVQIGELTVEVLGTHFNVMAYPNEKGATTLLEGSVRLSRNEQHVILKPGEQGIFIPGPEHTDMQVLQGIDIDNVVAWKENKFYFFHADLSSVLRQLARWYDVDIEFQGPSSKRPYDFERKRTNITLYKVLELLNLHHHWEGEKLIVTEQ